MNSRAGHLLEHELSRTLHGLQAGRKELQVQVGAIGGPLEATEASDAEVNIAQTRRIGQPTVVQRLFHDLRVVGQTTDWLAMGGHVQLLELTVLGFGCKARGLSQVGKDVDV